VKREEEKPVIMSGNPRPATLDSEVWMPPELKEQSGTERFLERSKKEPFIPLGLAGALGVLAYGAYSYKNRSAAFTLSRYIVRLRVLAQGTVLAAIMAGVGYTTTRDLLKSRNSES